MKTRALKTPSIYLSVVTLFFFVSSITAQTLTLNNTAPVIGESFLHQRANYVNEGGSGQGQLWNFKNLVPNGIDTVKNYLALSALSANSFTNANMGYKFPKLEMFLRADSTGLFEEGCISNSTPYTPVFGSPNSLPHMNLILKFPFSYLDSAELNTSYFIGTTNYLHDINTSIFSDATGTLITPSGTYSNAIRIKREILDTYINTYFPGHRYTTNKIAYEWYSPGIHTPVLSIISTTFTPYNHDPILTIKYNSWSEIYSDVNQTPLSLKNDNVSDEFELSFQNPVNEELRVNLKNSNYDIFVAELIDLNGKVILSQSFQTNSLTLNVSDYNKGVYILEVRNASGKQSRKKVIVN